MSLHAFNCGCNAIGYQKNNKNYIMCCAWAQMIDYDKISMLLGSQSVTGKNLEIGDIVGVSALSAGQMDIANKLGEGHSDVVDKLNGVSYELKDSAILINDAKTKLYCKVIDILHLPYIKEDNFVILEVLSSEVNDKDFLQCK